MTDQSTSNGARDPLDDLVSELLECGGVLSQIISHMIEFEASGKSAPDAAPIPEVAHSLIRSVIGHVQLRNSRGHIRAAARIVGEVTEAICNEIYFVPPEFIKGEGASG